MTTLDLTRWLTIADAARVANRTEKAMRQLRARRLKGENVGPRFRKVDGRILVSAEDLETWLAGDDTDSAPLDETADLRRRRT